MSLNQNHTHRTVSRAHWAWLLPILALSPLALGAKGCNSGVVGNDCPTASDCPTGTAGTAGTGGTGSSGNPVGKSCGGLLGTSCAAGLFCDFPTDAMCGAADQTGICTAKPDACTLQYAPVCGCDGKTYGNDCAAQAAGISVASEGECDSGSGGTSGAGGSGAGGGSSGATCGGLQGLTCPADQYCDFPAAAQCGAADQTGKCAVKPQICDAIYAPVCGCDDKTYSSDCTAARAGVSVAKTGECASGGKSCGGRGGGTCAAGEYCLYTPAAMCGRADATGTCTTIPKDTACLAVYDPVCGCDGKTYSNDCTAALAGASIDHAGACSVPATTCGGLVGKTCPSGYFCDYPAAMACGNADGTGDCKVKPEVCTQISDPVCGCDGKPYGNPCLANAAGTSVANQGACP